MTSAIIYPFSCVENGYCCCWPSPLAVRDESVDQSEAVWQMRNGKTSDHLRQKKIKKLNVEL